MVVLDTDHLSLLEQDTSETKDRLQARLQSAGGSRLVTTIVSFEEQTRGWLGRVAAARTLAAQVDAYRKLNRHLDTYRAIEVLDFDERASAEFQRLRQAHIRIGTMDLKIAAIVLAHNATLLTRNRRDFGKVPGLNVEDWTI